MNYLLALFLLLSSTSILFGQENELVDSIEKGAKIYKKNCTACHTKKGTGKGKRIPPLAKSDFLMSNRQESIMAIKYGMERKITVNGVVYDKSMKAVDLSDQEIADVMNYVLNTWGNHSDRMVSADEVAAIQKD